MRYPSLRRSVLETTLKAFALGLNPGASGNVSARSEDGMVITPSGTPYEEMRAEDLVDVREDGRVSGAQAVPSTEWRLHKDLYQCRADVGAIVHTHSRFATTLACLRRPLPAIHYMIAVTGGPLVRCAAYATFGTAELSAEAGRALEGSKACLLANHGMVAVGADLAEALKVAREVENLAEQYWRALQVGQPHLLDDAEIARVIERFKSYGQPVRRMRFG